MKKLLMLALPLFALTACDKDEGVGDDTESAMSDEELAAELWTAVQGWEDWDSAEGWPELSISEDGTHGDFVTIKVNSVEAAGGGDGSIIVKKGFDDAEGASARDGVTVMWQTDLYDSESGWFWAKFDADGNASPVGNPDGCTGCHSQSESYQTYKVTSPGTAE